MDNTLLTLMESLTTSDAEDWNILVDGQRVHITAMQEWQGRTQFRHGIVMLQDLKNLVRNLPPHPKLGSIMFILATDAEATGALKTLKFLQRFAKRKNFSLVSLIANAPTKECAERGNNWALYHCTTEGRA
jgi:hypothetical protein